MPLLSLILTNTTRNATTGYLNDGSVTPSPIQLYGSVPKQPIILTSYFIEFSEEVEQKKYTVKLPFLGDFDCNTNNLVPASFPIFSGVGRTVYRECDYEFNLARPINQNTNDYNIYFSSTDTPLRALIGYEITLNFTYRRPELV